LESFLQKPLLLTVLTNAWYKESGINKFLKIYNISIWNIRDMQNKNNKRGFRMEIGRDGEVDCRWVESLMVIPCPNAIQTLLVYIYIVKNICFSRWGKAG
jgi:hypothetical protein